jgi:hypothetical protein
MKNIVLVVMLSLSAAACASSETSVSTYNLGTLLNAVALNGAAATRTFTIAPQLSNYHSLLEYSTLVTRMTYDYDSNAGALSMTCTEGDTTTTATGSLTVCSTISSGTCTVDFSGVMTTASLSADKKWTWSLGIAGSQALSCVVAQSGSPGASEKITVTGFLLGSGV